MKNFKLSTDMLTLGGIFYPRGYAFIMFANAEDADQVALELQRKHEDTEQVMRLSPEVILRDIGKVEGDSDIALPSVGTEGATVRKYVDLARLGHHALMVKVSSDQDTERLMRAARKPGFSYAQRYHLLVIEDLE